MKKEAIEFYEVQRFRQWWMWGIILFANVIVLFAIFQQYFLDNQFGNGWASPVEIILIIVGIAFANFVSLGSKLHTYINNEGIYVKFFPFHFRYKFYDWNNLQAVYVRKYSAFREFGGWGFRVVTMNADRAYNVSGNMGLQLVLMNGKKVLIGTKQPKHLTDILTKLGKMKIENG
ncbi:MAG: hypothetical protein Q4G63_08540 [Bacteroidia bacterium]|nr:hypothetical protein [Bacteroidia bacterium]